MKICYHCRKPITQCECSQERRIAWEKAARAEKQQMWQHIQRERQKLEKEKPSMSEEFYLRELEYLEEDQEEWQSMPENYEDYSFEIDDDILDTILTLWEKGYDTRYCCAGHPDYPAFIYIVFCRGYYFDFTNSGLDDNWKYSGDCDLCYQPTQKALRQMEKQGIDLYEHLCEQRELLNRWVHQLPPARKREKDEQIRGIWMRHRRTKKELEAAKGAALAFGR